MTARESPEATTDERTVCRPCRHRPEQQIQRAVFQHLRQRGAPNVFAFHPANGGWRSAVEGAILKGLGVVAGMPDVIVLKDGVTYALELKAEGGRLSETQRATHAAMIAAGAVVGVAHGIDQALAWLERRGLVRGSTQRSDAGAEDRWRRFRQELAAAPTRDAAADLFQAHEFLFLGMRCDERECRYAEVEDAIKEKPEQEDYSRPVV